MDLGNIGKRAETLTVRRRWEGTGDYENRTFCRT